MPKYTMIVTRDVTESALVTVEADDAVAAEEAALAAIMDAPALTWEIDDGSWDQGNPYVTETTKERVDE